MALSEIMKFKKLQYNIGDLIHGPRGVERVNAFNDLISYYRDKLKAINGKIIYAYLTPDDTEPNSTQFDFCIIMKIKNEIGHEIILVECPIRYSDKCLASYLYCKSNNKLDDYYYETMKLTCRLSLGRFDEYINVMCELSTIKDHDLYWKKPLHVNTLLDKFGDLSMRYTPSMYQQQ